MNKFELLKGIISLGSGYACEQVMKEVVDVAFKPCDSKPKRVIKIIGASILVAVMAEVSGEWAAKTCDEVKDIADVIKEAKKNGEVIEAETAEENTEVKDERSESGQDCSE